MGIEDVTGVSMQRARFKKIATDHLVSIIVPIFKLHLPPYIGITMVNIDILFISG